MNNYKMFFEQVDRIEEAEGHHVARQVGRFLGVIDLKRRFKDEDEIIAMCQDVFVHMRTSALTVDAQAREVLVLACLHDTAGEQERAAYAVAQVISHARQQFRQYLPHTISKLY